MSSTKRTVLTTGCSDGSLGAGLSIAFHQAGLKVYATSRNPVRMKGLEAMGIEILTLDVLDDKSIAKIAAEIPQLDILGKEITILVSRTTKLTNWTSE
jgi:1-acylglycerone phosphate reductase